MAGVLDLCIPDSKVDTLFSDYRMSSLISPEMPALKADHKVKTLTCKGITAKKELARGLMKSGLKPTPAWS